MKLYKILSNSEIFSNIPQENFNSMYEAEIVLQTLMHLGNIYPDVKKKFSIVILLNNGIDVKKWDLDSLHDKRKVFIIFDEKGRVPLELTEQNTDIVFHAHLSFAENERKHSNLFHYPLGCNSFVPELPYIAISKRNINVFFSGNLHAGRKQLYQSLTKLHYIPLPILARVQKYLKLKFDAKFPSSYLRFTEGFSKGFSFREYSNYLAESKIIISPPGISNPECFRHYEGLRAGCVVIAERLPVKPQFEGSPIIEVKDWHNGFRVIQNLLDDPEKLEEISQQSFAWYRDHLSPPAVARYMYDKISIASKNN